MTERRGTKALETWCRRLTEGYPGVKVENMTTSWRDGLAFCAIIHHFRPDLIDFASLSPSNVYYNNSLAFSIAERQLGIPALLDAEDMAMYDVPDRLSILTYLSQFYQVFGNQTVSAGGKQGTSQRIVPKRSAISADRGMISPASSSPPTKMASLSSRGVTGSGLGRREPCAKCALPVFLAERLNVGTKLFHRTCFRCARCNTQLSLANYYETETDEFCCETCPDEEDQPTSKVTKFDSLDNVKSILSTDAEQKADSSDSLSQATDIKKFYRFDPMRIRSLSDEEKSKGLQRFEDDEYSADFEHALEESNERKDNVLYEARNLFLSTQMLNEILPEEKIKMNTEDESKINIKKEILDKPPPLPDSEPPDISLPEEVEKKEFISPEDPSSIIEIEDTPVKAKEDSEEILTILPKEEGSEPSLTTLPIENVSEQNLTTSLQLKDSEESPTTSPKEEKKQVSEEITVPESSASLVNNVDFNVNNTNNSNKKDQHSTASEEMLEETTTLREKNITKDTNRSSLVKSRMLLFESGNKEEKINFNKETVPSKVNKKDIANLDQEEIEARSDYKEETTQYVSTSSEDKDKSFVSEEANYKTVRSEFNNSDSVFLCSTVSEDSPLNNSDTTSEDMLTKSVPENVSSDLSYCPIDSSLLKDSEESSTENPKIEISEIIEKEEHLNNEDEYPEDLNPFGSDDEDAIPKKPTRKVIKPSMEDLTIISPPVNDQEKRKSTNPFGSSDEEEEELKYKPPRPPMPAVRGEGKKVVQAPRVSLNPFWSDGEEPNDEEVNAKPVPKPRSKHITTPEPKPRHSGLSNSASHYDSSSSLSSMSSSISHTPGRRKKPAPPPPTYSLNASLTPEGSKQSSPSTSRQPSPKLTPRVRKNRKAPLPPSSTPFISPYYPGDQINISPIISLKSDATSKTDTEESSILSPGSDVEYEKNSKDEKNRNRQSQNLSSPILSDSDSLSLSQQCTSSDKSTHGKWKRKKGPAPARPVPQRRQIRPLPLAELRRELDIIEMQQQGLEKQGVKLEQLIREKCETPGTNDDTALTPEVEDLVLELFELVNEKNELFRRQAELMYLRRQQRLEEEHADLEYQIRCLMDRPERNKTDSDKAREEELINRLLEVVERRNEIVECLEMDRVREAEEDQSINFHLSQLASKKEEQIHPESPVKLSKKEKKKMKKEKKLKEKGKNLDADKDIDESETSMTSIKEKKKKKWF